MNRLLAALLCTLAAAGSMAVTDGTVKSDPKSSAAPAPAGTRQPAAVPPAASAASGAATTAPKK